MEQLLRIELHFGYKVVYERGSPTLKQVLTDVLTVQVLTDRAGGLIAITAMIS